ncbi:hypothetical protein EPUS_07873 [Endocarpon pusillum Z07020]|uniref:F-box domain-containing protein n=1 Tax=Endocarpon pusillum (strain Z07020 / HMAS-L-300199) TaxID=1263415 RepID=U1GFQ7_ENDPU|nr:uncharacterized protein EPUS_07873 [Endocarpon pusillum Z07020]ERF70576.1 hypothetical protein EPUS_07873 [Endocarpon pusillum Z07020]
MSPNSLQGSASPAPNPTRHANDGTFQVTASFNHGNFPDGQFFLENENTFLTAVDVSKYSQSPLWPNLLTRTLMPLNNFERLPLELTTLIMEYLDISSLVAMASVNLRMRKLVQELPAVKKIQQNVYAARAVNRMYTSGTAKFFSLTYFMAKFTSWICTLCQRREFAVVFCLLLCRRLCRTCYGLWNFCPPLPVTMAMECFQLDHEEITCKMGSALMPIPPSAQRQSCCGQLRRPGWYPRVEVVSIAAAADIARSKYNIVGGLDYLHDLVSNYLMEHNIDSHRNALRDIMLWDKSFPGLLEAIRTYWSLLGVDPNIQSDLLFTTLPYLHPRRTPLKVESGFWCVGCQRDLVLKCAFNPIRTPNYGGLAVYVREAFPKHLSTCHTARQIKKGILLPPFEEYKLTRHLFLKRMEYWPKGYRCPSEVIRLYHRRPGDRNWTATQFREWHAESLRRIIELGERDRQCRAQLADFKHHFDEKCRLSSGISTSHTVCKLTVGAGNPQSHGKTGEIGFDRGLHADSGRSDAEKSSPPMLQKHDDNMSRSRSSRTAELAEDSPKSSSTTIPHDETRSDDMTSTSGRCQVSETGGKDAVPATLPTNELAQAEHNIHPVPVTKGNESKDQNGNGSLGSDRPSEPFADNLQNLGVSKEKALVPGLWEVRKNEAVDDSDEESVGSKKNEDDSKESDDSDEEI